MTFKEGGKLSMEKAKYRIECRPSTIYLECPHCEMDFEVDFDILVDSIHSEDGFYEVLSGNSGVIVTCDYCEEEVELGDAEVD